MGKDHPDTATSHNNLAFYLDDQGRMQEAVHYWMAATEISERARYARSSSGLERAVGSNASDQAAPLGLTLALARQGQFREARRRWESSLSRGVLDDFSARRLRPLTGQERQHEADLVGQLQQLDERIGRLVAKPGRNQAEDQRLEEWRRGHDEIRGRFVAFENALEERYRAFAGHPAGLAEVRDALPHDAALLGWVDLRSQGETYPSKRLRHWACIVRKSGEPIWIQIPGSGAEEAWRRRTRIVPRRSAPRSPMRRRPSWHDLAATLARQRLEPLRSHLEGVRHLIVLPSADLAGIPVEALVAAWPRGRDRFVVSYAPSGSMFARLRQPRGKGGPGPPRLLALGDPAYPPAAPGSPPPTPPEQGLAILAVLPHGTADLFGLTPGDVLLEYNGIVLTSAADLKVVPVEVGAKRVPVKLWRNGEVRTVELAAGPLGIQYNPGRKAADVVQARRAADEALEPLTRGEALEPLPGTRREIEAIAHLFPVGQVTTLLGAAATERAVQERARSGELKGYRFLHFATHGRSNPAVAMSSAVMLAPDPDRPADPTALEADGRISAEQIVQTWDLDADLVVLSACETGLGRYAGGEGYLGFAQALFIKGARSLVLSQWKVSDRSTTLLMTRFYAHLLGRTEGLPAPLAKAEALHEAKRWLRGLTVEQAEVELKRLNLDRPARDPAALADRGVRRISPAAGSSRPFEHPYHWAGFLLVGDPK